MLSMLTLSMLQALDGRGSLALMDLYCNAGQPGKAEAILHVCGSHFFSFLFSFFGPCS